MSTVFKDLITITGLAGCFPSNPKTFKQLQVEMTLEIPPEKPDMEYMQRDFTDIDIKNTFVLETPCAKSHEGQILTGHKLMISGVILQKVEYAAHNCTHSVHAAEFSTEFSTYIILDDNVYQPATYKVTAYLEDVFIKQLDKRRLYKNVMLLLDAVPTSTELIGSPCFEPLPNNKREISVGNEYDCSCIPVPNRFFSQFCCEEILELPCSKPDIEQIVSVIADPEVISVKFINAVKGISKEGQHLTGKKAIIGIKFRQKVLYAADCPDQSIYGAESLFYKSAYIVLPPLIEGTDPELLYKSNLLKVKLAIEDTCTTKLDKRRIFKSVCVFAELIPVPTYEICYSSYRNCAESELFLCNEDGRCSTQITKCKNFKSIKPCWSPAGNQIAYLSGTQSGYTLFNFNIKDNSHKMLTPYDAFDNISSFSWLKDSQQIIFSAVKNNSKELYLFSITKDMCWQITYGAYLIKSYYPKVSPDGYNVAYLRSSTCYVDLWYSDIHGKNPRKITNTGTVKDYDWLADSEGLVYIDNKNEHCCEIYLKTLDENPPTCVVSSNSLYGCKAVSVSPDGSFIAFVGTNKCSDDIYVYDMHKEKLFNITKHHNNIKINCIVWKIDSSKIYYAAREFVHYNICSVDVASLHKEVLTNTSSSYMQLAYRPKVK